MPEVPTEIVDGHRIERTGEFLTDDEWSDLQRPVSRLWDLGVTGEQQWPAKLARMARDHELEPREDGHTRWAVDPDTRELCYAVTEPLPSPTPGQEEITAQIADELRRRFARWYDESETRLFEFAAKWIVDLVASSPLPAAGLSEEEELLKAECERRGLPVSLRVLLRHLDNNHAAALGAVRDSNQTLRDRLARLASAPNREEITNDDD